MVELDSWMKPNCEVLYCFITVFIWCIFNVKGRTIRGLQQHVRILDILNVSLDEFGQMAVPSTSHLQYEQQRISQGRYKEK